MLLSSTSSWLACRLLILLSRSNSPNYVHPISITPKPIETNFFNVELGLAEKGELGRGGGGGTTAHVKELDRLVKSCRIVVVFFSLNIFQFSRLLAKNIPKDAVTFLPSALCAYNYFASCVAITR